MASTQSGNRSLRILVLSPVEPYPPSGGWQTVIYNDIKFLALRGHQIKLLALTYDPTADPASVEDVADAEFFLITKPPKWRQVVANSCQRLPYTIVRHNDARMMERARWMVDQGDVDVVLIQDVVMGCYANLFKNVPTFLRGHNVSSQVVRRFYLSQRNPVMRFLGWRQWVKFARYEAAVMTRFDGVSQISPSDVEQAAKLNPDVCQRLLYSGVDLDFFAYAPPAERDSNTIVHVGTLDPITKLPAMFWFADEVLPLIRERHPDVRLELAGRMPACRLDQTPGINVHGLVDDVRPLLGQGAVFIATQFVGSGIRIKILNAMACGNAVVATSVACEGLPVTHGTDILVADDPETFAKCVSELMESNEKRDQMGRAARKLVEDRFGWSAIAEQLDGLLRDAVERHAASNKC